MKNAQGAAIAMNRRNAIKQLGILAGGLSFIPYACSLSPEKVYTNLPTLKKEQQDLIGWLSNNLLPEDVAKFPTPESRQDFVLTMVNDCMESEKIKAFLEGFEAFQTRLAATTSSTLTTLSVEAQKALLIQAYEDQSLSKSLINPLKQYSLLHFESSENYMKNYLDFEFMPGRYLGSVPLVQDLL